MTAATGELGIAEAMAILDHAAGIGGDPAPMTSTPRPAAYPVDVLPPAVAGYVEAAAAALDCPPEMVAVPLLIFAGAVVGNTRHIVVKRGWEQRAILWAAVVAAPGTAKTPALGAARLPIQRLQADAVARWEGERHLHEQELAAWEALPKKDRAGRDKPQPPSLRHYFTSDATKEALGLLSASSEGIAVSRDELLAWVLSFDAYRAGKGGDKQDMLSLWAGEPLKIDRKSAAPIWSPRPTVGIVGGIQPDRLSELQQEAGQDGFLDRFLWAYPDTKPMAWTDAEIDPAAEEAVVTLFRRLRADPGGGEGRPVRLSAGARAAFVAWHDENAAMQAGAAGLVRGTFAKLPNQAARLALVLHCLWQPDPDADTLSREAMEDAIALAEYHRAHALRVLAHFSAVGSGGFAGLPQRVLRHLERAAERGDPLVTRTTLHRALGNSVRADDLTGALAELERAGVVAGQRIETGGKPAEAWRAGQRRMNELDELSPSNAAAAGKLHPTSFIRDGGVDPESAGD